MPTNHNHGYLTEPRRKASEPMISDQAYAYLATGLAMAVIVYAMTLVRIGS